MTDCDFWQKLALTVVDKLLLAVIVLIVGYYLNRVLEEFKGRLSREQEALKTANQAVVDLTRKLAAGSQLISWLAWGATQDEVSLRDEDFETYDKGMIEVLGDLVGLQASVAALSYSKFQVLSAFAEELYQRDVEVGKARNLFRANDLGKMQRCIEILSLAYEEALAFDERLLKAVSGLLEPAKPRGCGRSGRYARVPAAAQPHSPGRSKPCPASVITSPSTSCPMARATCIAPSSR
jgi:hypothetical protein